MDLRSPLNLISQSRHCRLDDTLIIAVEPSLDTQLATVATAQTVAHIPNRVFRDADVIRFSAALAPLFELCCQALLMDLPCRNIVHFIFDYVCRQHRSRSRSCNRS